MSETTYHHDEAGVTVEIDVSERYRLLSNDQRRTAIRALCDRTGPVSLSELATDVARRERDGDDDAESDPERVRIQLHHVHLPRLAEAGLLRYDRESAQISQYRAASALLP